jgi:16S rRNA (guanine966-N2)-methyltransferase
MRIIGGKYRGRPLAKVRGDVRPTLDRLRETLFSVINDSLPHSLWVDFFAGSGSVAIEAASRGADFVLFNDRDRISIKLIETNIDRVGMEIPHRILQKDALTLIRQPSKDFIERTPTHVYLDPPFDFGRYTKLLSKLAESDWIDEDTLVILEFFKKNSTDLVPEVFSIQRQMEVGDSRILILKLASKS